MENQQKIITLLKLIIFRNKIFFCDNYVTENSRIRLTKSQDESLAGTKWLVNLSHRGVKYKRNKIRSFALN